MAKTCGGPAGTHLCVLWDGGEGLRDGGNAGSQLILCHADVYQKHIGRRQHQLALLAHVLNRGEFAEKLRRLILFAGKILVSD